MPTLLIILVVLAALIGGMYNSLVTLKNKVEAAWSDIDTHLKKRYDLIPNLVETVKGYATHEKETFENITKARTAAMNAGGMTEQAGAENMLSGTLKSIFALAENYPDLKANTNFQQLQTSLEEIEGHINMARRYYNGAVKDLNTKVEVFPNNIIANIFGFTKKEYFELDNEEERKNVQVKF